MRSTGDHGFSLTHEACALASNEHGVTRSDAASSVGGCDFAHGHAHRRRWRDPKRGQQVRLGDLDRGDGDLSGLGVVGQFVVVNDVQH